MKLVTMALACMLLAGMWLQDVEGRSMHVSSSNCCFVFVERKIPQRIIQCYKRTSSTCSRRSLIIKLRGGRETCVLETASWVKHHLKTMKPCPLK
ncbi:C-C motif chemokine 1 [Mirounga angustirostris]|uniref:C-C motif chemokine 1 n=1 Tax=Mirounga angustirostris TaxID=9716 RepID=UPI001E68AD8B|nr:C-C motif chemokine 1 [Mirounga angustirostris]